MTSRDPKRGKICTLVEPTEFLNVKERTFYCKKQHSNERDTSFYIERISSLKYCL